jgi:hypothetical protein
MDILPALVLVIVGLVLLAGVEGKHSFARRRPSPRLPE